VTSGPLEVGSAEGKGRVACTLPGSLEESVGGRAAPVCESVRAVIRKIKAQPHRIVKPMMIETIKVRLLVRMKIR
jgi:hypothetical protein